MDIQPNIPRSQQPLVTFQVILYLVQESNAGGWYGTSLCLYIFSFISSKF